MVSAFIALTVTVFVGSMNETKIRESEGAHRAHCSQTAVVIRERCFADSG